MRQDLMEQPQQVLRRAMPRSTAKARLTPQAAAENRFAGRFQHDRLGQDQWCFLFADNPTATLLVLQARLWVAPVGARNAGIILCCRRSEEPVSVGLGMMPRE
jgi:hypothetical protein